MKQFDRWIKSELNQYEASRPDAAWEQFASRMDQANDRHAEETEFDQTIKRKLESIQAPYTTSHWQLLREKLETQARIRSEMLRIKVLEAVLFALIFITLWQLQPDSSPVQQPVLPIAGLLDDVQPSRENAIAELVPSSPATSTQETNQDLSIVRSDQIPSTPMLMDGPSAQLQLSQLVPLSGGGKRDGFHSSEDDTQPQFRAPATDQLVADDRSHRVPTDLLPTASLNLLIAEPQPLQSMHVNQKSSIRHRVSMAINGDLNYVMTPYDQLLVNKGYDQLVTGYGGWIGYAWEGPKWALRTALSYHRKYYLPKPYTEVFDGDFERGYFSETLRDIELNLFSLSIHGQRTISRKNRLHTYGLMGGTGHMAFQANYDRKQSYAPGTNTQGGEIPEPLVPSKTSQKKYADGFFEGGSFAENSYVTIDLGIGIERFLNERTSVFFEPVYQHNPFQKALGPNKDRINTLSLSTGVRVNL